jgi:hypothetical protein
VTERMRVHSWAMFGFHHFLDQMDGCFVGVDAIMGAVSMMRFVVNHSGIGVSMTGVTLNWFMKSIMSDHVVRSLFGKDVA